MRALDAEAWAHLVDRLRRLRANGELTAAEVRRVAGVSGVAERTVWRWVRKGQAQKHQPASYDLSTDDVDAFVAANGNVAAAWRVRRAAGEGIPSLRTFQRAVGRGLLPGQRAGLVEGETGLRRHAVFLRWEPTHRNAVWEGDHKELPVLVLPPRAQRPCRPWATLFLDGYSRLVMGWAISLYPSSATVLAALHQAILIDPERGPFGGVPDALHWDNGLEFAAAALKQAAGVLGCAAPKMPAYTPHLRGKAERNHRTIDDSFVSGLPFYTGGPRGADGRLRGSAGGPISLELFVQLFADYVHSYNTVRPHGALAGQTPLERWCRDATPIRSLSSTELRWLLLAGEKRRVLSDGIHFKGLTFIAPELNGRVGQRVEVRYMPHDFRQVEVFVDDRWLATAKPQGLLTKEERDAILAQRRADAAELSRRQRRASRRARSRLAPIIQPGQPEETTVISAKQARADRSERGRDENLRRLARTDLLGLDHIADLYRQEPKSE